MPGFVGCASAKCIVGQPSPCGALDGGGGGKYCRSPGRVGESGTGAMLYVGDTLYERAPIIFPNEGSIVRWRATVDALIALLEASGKGREARG